MKLQITTPLEIVADVDGVTSLRAEDPTGSFGILPGHAEFITSLVLTVVSWKASGGQMHYCAVRGGVLTVRHGSEIQVASREAVSGDDLDTLDESVLARFRSEQEAQKVEYSESTRLQLAAIRQIVRNLKRGSA